MKTAPQLFSIVLVALSVSLSGCLELEEDKQNEDSDYGIKDLNGEKSPESQTESDDIFEGVGEFTGLYEKAATSETSEVERLVRGDKYVERTTKALNAEYTLPVDLVTKYKDCDEENAFYDPNKSEIVMCYEFINLVDRVHTDSKSGRPKSTYLLNVNEFVFYHELGHALIHLYNLPTTGKEEDVADQFSTWTLIKSGKPQAAIDAAQFWMAGADESQYEHAYWDTHSLDAQRNANILCWVYGSNPKKYGDIVKKGLLNEERAGWCEFEFQKMDQSLSGLLKPYRK